jgi:ATP-dependent Clp protease ATP-binding subunit ClpC
MDEAAAKLRVALYSMPPDLKALKTDIDKLHAEEEQAGLNRDYERAAQKKAERLRLEQEYNGKRDKWEVDHQLDEVVDVDDIASVVHQWTGIPVTQMLETESKNSCTWKRVCMSASSVRKKPFMPSPMPSAAHAPG